MILENISTYNWVNSLRGMRNPKKSWNKNDTCVYYDNKKGEIPFIGPNDLKLSSRLIKAGTDHRKFLRQIFISVDVSGTLKFFDQFSQYKFQVTNSTSQMHTSGTFLFTKKDFNEYVFQETIDKLNDYISFRNIITTQEIRKELWKKIIYNTPSGYIYKRTATFNYETFLSMYQARKDHKLDEWVEFCEKLREELPYIDYWLSLLEGWIYI